VATHGQHRTKAWAPRREGKTAERNKLSGDAWKNPATDKNSAVGLSSLAATRTICDTARCSLGLIKKGRTARTPTITSAPVVSAHSEGCPRSLNFFPGFAVEARRCSALLPSTRLWGPLVVTRRRSLGGSGLLGSKATARVVAQLPPRGGNRRQGQQQTADQGKNRSEQDANTAWERMQIQGLPILELKQPFRALFR